MADLLYNSTLVFGGDPGPLMERWVAEAEAAKARGLLAKNQGNKNFDDFLKGAEDRLQAFASLGSSGQSDPMMDDYSAIVYQTLPDKLKVHLFLDPQFPLLEFGDRLQGMLSEFRRYAKEFGYTFEEVKEEWTAITKE